MDTEELAREANFLYEAVSPLLEIRGENFRNILLLDLVNIGLLYGYSNEEFDSDELFAYAHFLQ